jgi:hypothetical protein
MGTLTLPTANTAQSEGLDVLRADLVSIQRQITIAEQIRQITRYAEALVLQRDKADLVARLKPGSWCVAECLDHLTQTTRAFLPAMLEAIAEAPKLTRHRRLRTGFLASLFYPEFESPIPDSVQGASTANTTESGFRNCMDGFCGIAVSASRNAAFYSGSRD